MSDKQGYYALLQYSAIPERFEFVNVGVALFVPDRRLVKVRFSHGLKRVERLFGKQPSGYLDVLKSNFESRLLSEAASLNLERLVKFANSRANKMRVSNLLPIVVDDADADIDQLFNSLVGEDEISPRRRKVSAELKDKFEVAGVDAFLQKPEPVRLPQGVTIDAPFAYQNGAYNLIDAVRLHGDAGDALAQASERAVKGQWLHQYSKHAGKLRQLVVVGDFASQDHSFRHAVHQMMQEHYVRLYDLNEVQPLIEDIRSHGRVHLSS
jgi:hypothetical protein